MKTHDSLAVAAGRSVDPTRWREQFDDLMGRTAGRFDRVEPRRRARAFVLGLLSGLRRKNCWTIAEQAGDATPGGMQHLLSGARWDADMVRDDVRAYVVEHLGSADAVLVVDETGDVKKGTATAGVQRQYSGTAGRVENCQVARFSSCAAPAGHALIDRELYLPRSWAADPARCAAAGIPGKTVFATKPGRARRMPGRALDAGTPAAWVTGDEVYGADPGLRADLERCQIGYVLAVAASHQVVTAAGPGQARQIAARLPPDDQIPLTRNEIAALFSTLSSTQQKMPGTGCDGLPGDGTTSTAPKPATTSGKPANHEDYKVRLEY